MYFLLYHLRAAYVCIHIYIFSGIKMYELIIYYSVFCTNFLNTSVLQATNTVDRCLASQKGVGGH